MISESTKKRLEKVKEMFMWTFLIASCIFMIALCSTAEYIKSQELYRVLAPGIHDSCHTIEQSSCGINATSCTSGKDYKCLTNVSVEPIK